MALAEYASGIPPELLSAIERKGFSELTAVQRAVLDESLSGRDLRITSQTGSGKTLAIGLILRTIALEPSPAKAGVARPRALVIAPTRELAHQVQEELTWLYADGGGRLATTTGGASYRDEMRSLGKGATVVVGTPGRLLDHLRRGSIDPSQVAAVVLDEADRMLELGFREDLEAIFQTLPAERRTHLVSATFPRVVRSLADRVQSNPAHVEGTRLGQANADIDHVIHIVESQQRLAAIINLLLAHPDEQMLVFVRMRADASALANELVMNGFAASGLSGEMEQGARTRTLGAFKQGGLRCLIATDVAARGIDVQDVARVIHAELPTNADAYTHRSGRTGRAGRRGTSSMLVAPAGVVHATRLLRGLGIAHRFEPIPTIEEIQRADDERTFTELTTAEPNPNDEARFQTLAERLIEAGAIDRTLARLLAKSRATTAQPREVRNFAERPSRVGPNKRERFEERDDRRQRRQGLPAREPNGSRDQPASRERARDQLAPSAPLSGPAPAPRGRSRNEDGPRERPRRTDSERGFTPFRVSWGQRKGADARRLLAVVCRRGDIRGRDVGAIRVEPNYAIVDVANDVAEDFARAAAAPDPREPGVTIRRDTADVGASPLPRSEGARFAPRPAVKPRPAPRKPFKRGAGKA